VSSAKLIEYLSAEPVAQPSSPPRANILGVGVHAIDLPQAAGLIEAAIAAERKGYVCVTGVHGVMEAQRSAEFRSILNRSFLVTPDGMPTVWVGKMQGHHHMRRVFGPDLMFEVCRRSPARGYTHFLYGGKPGVAEHLRGVLTQSFLGIEVVGTYTPPFRDLSSEEETGLIRQISQSKPDIIWVGLSTPRQERFMSKYLHRLESTLMIGVGAAFDIHTGRIKDAPSWMKKSGLQWLHRLYQEPSRLWKRYLINNCGFAAKLVVQLSRLKNYELEPVLEYGKEV
jgi:N-acetylglucosaminyldiphosphoundecaprenol N-acetyl-beta-D-mannosaminyltransferase